MAFKYSGNPTLNSNMQQSSGDKDKMGAGKAPHTHEHTPLSVIKNSAIRSRVGSAKQPQQFLKKAQSPGAGPGRKSR